MREQSPQSPDGDSSPYNHPKKFDKLIFLGTPFCYVVRTYKKMNSDLTSCSFFYPTFIHLKSCAQLCHLFGRNKTEAPPSLRTERKTASLRETAQTMRPSAYKNARTSCCFCENWGRSKKLTEVNFLRYAALEFLRPRCFTRQAFVWGY